MNKLLLIVAFAIYSLMGIAQQIGPNISWDEASYNFGDIKEEDGPVTHKFAFTNTGNEPLVITQVKPSCGCTSSDYTKQPVAPGAKGFVSATYSPAHRPGSFNKSITVTTNATPPTSTIRFNGNVIPKPKTLADEYPKAVGKLNFVSSHMAFSKVLNTEVANNIYTVVNLQGEPLKISFDDVPSHITIKAAPETLAPQQKGEIQVSYNGTQQKDWGFLIDRVTLVINGEKLSNDRLTISATMEEDFAKMSPQDLANAPVAVFDSLYFNFGSIDENAVVNRKFTLTNKGKNTLEIRKINASCGCTVVKPSSTSIKGGDSAEVMVTFNARGRKGQQNKTITIITNDPKNSTIRLGVKGDVKYPNQN